MTALDITENITQLDPTRLHALFERIMRIYSVSDEESALADALEEYLRGYAHLEVHRHEDTVVVSTHFGSQEMRVSVKTLREIIRSLQLCGGVELPI